MKLLSYKEPHAFPLLAIVEDVLIEAATETYPCFLANNPDLHPVFRKGDEFYVATNYIIIYPEVHVVTFRERQLNEAVTTSHIQ